MTAAGPSIKMAIIAGCGAVLSKRGLLDGQAAKSIGALSNSLFMPALIFSNLGKGFNPESMEILWVIPVIVILNIAMGLALSLAYNRLFLPDKHAEGCIHLFPKSLHPNVEDEP